eukprot:scaffold1344_cov388-Prasinococcus_capsulatus_cf.AAC.12
MASAAPTAHVARVRALYRQGLRTILNWAVDREVFYVEVRAARGCRDARHQPAHWTWACSVCALAWPVLNQPARCCGFASFDWPCLFQADRLRTAFEGNRHLTLPLEIEKVVADGEKTLAQMAHPDPYTGEALSGTAGLFWAALSPHSLRSPPRPRRKLAPPKMDAVSIRPLREPGRSLPACLAVPWRPGGSKFARNPPLPDVSMVNDFGRTPY